MKTKNTRPSRPLLRYFGGKYRLAGWILSHLPSHTTYVEPFLGAGSVFFAKSRAPREVLNDLDDEIVNLFRVLRDRSMAEDLRFALQHTPYARSEWRLAGELPDISLEPVERARRALMRSFMGFGADAFHLGTGTGFRGDSKRTSTIPAHDWANWPQYITTFCERLSGVIIENTDALKLMPAHDGPETLFYVDPPYVHSTRGGVRNSTQRPRHQYRHEMDDAAHVQLAETLQSLKGMVVLSGHPSSLYEELYPNWYRIERSHLIESAAKRVEALWLNPAAQARLEQTDEPASQLFNVA